MQKAATLHVVGYEHAFISDLRVFNLARTKWMTLIPFEGVAVSRLVIRFRLDLPGISHAELYHTNQKAICSHHCSVLHLDPSLLGDSRRITYGYLRS
jgi:hypothetical protein